MKDKGNSLLLLLVLLLQLRQLRVLLCVVSFPLLLLLLQLLLRLTRGCAAVGKRRESEDSEIPKRETSSPHSCAGTSAAFLLADQVAS